MQNRVALNQPSMSVVIAVWRDLAGLAKCLKALTPQLDPNVEVIVSSTVPIPKELSTRFSNALWQVHDEGLLIPELWGRGMSGATGDVVAITTSHFLPAQNWISTMREAHARLDARAIGGSFDPPREFSMPNWGTYFLRYSQYLQFRQEQVVAELAGDNASYKRIYLTDEVLENGFWELEFHRQLLQSKEALFFAPQIRVTQHAGFGFIGFIRQRFQHGLQFGHARGRQWKLFRRILALMASPLIPPILLAKIVFRVLRGGRLFGAFVYALPALCCFILAWALGEALGYGLAIAAPSFRGRTSNSLSSSPTPRGVL